jgi:hypothetical protein
MRTVRVDIQMFGRGKESKNLGLSRKVFIEFESTVDFDLFLKVL